MNTPNQKTSRTVNKCRNLVRDFIALIITIGFMLPFAEPGGAQNLLRNPSFETVTGTSKVQGILPNDWVQAGNIAPGADTWSNDGSYGLPPGNLSHFVGTVAQDGIRWVAGAWLSGGVFEAIAQSLTVALVPSQSYRLSVYLHQDVSSGFNHSGGYEVILSPTNSTTDSSAVLLGRLSATTGVNAWEFRTFDFTVPVSAASLPHLLP